MLGLILMVRVFREGKSEDGGYWKGIVRGGEEVRRGRVFLVIVEGGGRV